jgi:hypothetical protein
MQRVDIKGLAISSFLPPLMLITPLLITIKRISKDVNWYRKFKWYLYGTLSCISTCIFYTPNVLAVGL